MRVLITVEYDGKNFCGWQIQPGKRTVQGVLSDAFFSLFGKNTVIYGSGRTDSGVHALNQKAHFDYDGQIPTDKIPLAVNTLLPGDVSVKNACPVPDGFDARFSAKKKTYRYDFYFSRVHRPLYDSRAARVPFNADKFDIGKANEVLSLLTGTHDFAAFSSTGRPVESSVRTLFDASISLSGDIYSITVTGNGFLYNMVRIIAGTVIETALSLRPVSDVKKALESGNRIFCGKTFPPHGLTLISVDYDL